MITKIVTFLTSCCIALQMFSQDCDIAFRIIVAHPVATELQSPDISSYISNRLNNLNSNLGVLSSIENSQFAIMVEYNIIDKQIINGTPTKIIYDLNAMYSIVDLNSKKIFSSYNQTLKGIGNNEQKALLNSFQRINSRDSNLQRFIQEGKNQVVNYYNNNYSRIIKKAQSLASIRHFDEAIYNLMVIPDCCNGYNQVVSALMDIYHQFVNQHCNENLAQARAAWIASPDRDGAVSASIFLSEIYPDASCYEEASKLADEIKRRLGEVWKFEMKQWSDNIALETQRINAMRDIGIAYAHSQNTSRNTNSNNP